MISTLITVTVYAAVSALAALGGVWLGQNWPPRKPKTDHPG